MYNIMIVEDEELIRDSLINEIKWSEIGCRVAKGAESAESALGYLNEYPDSIDIVITDIRMGNMTGLDMADIIYKQYPCINVIIATGYGQIELIKKAIKLNVKDYILKPIEPSEIVNTVIKICREIKAEKDRQVEFDKLKKRVNENILLLQEQYFSALLSASVLSIGESAESKEGFLNLDFSSYYIFAVLLDKSITSGDDFEEVLKNKYAIVSEIKNANEENVKIILDIHNNDKIFGIVFTDNAEYVEEFGERLYELTYTKYNINTDMGISERGRGSEYVYALSKSAEEALYYTFYLGKGSVVSYGEISKKVKNDSFIPDSTVYETLIQSVNIGDTNEAIKRLGVLWNKFCRMISPNHIKKLCVDILYEYGDVCKKHGIEDLHFGDVFDTFAKIKKINDVKELEEYMLEITKKVSDQVYFTFKVSNKNIVMEAIDYINENYMNNITLDDIAGHVYLSEKYLCKILKQETGKTFKEIQNEKRIEKAIELLKNTNYKSYEIAEKVGLNDSRYFSQLFKKITGHTIREFKNMNG